MNLRIFDTLLGKYLPLIFPLQSLDDKTLIYEWGTGKFDSKGEEIFAGDLISCFEKMCELGEATQFIGKVVYDSSAAAFGLAYPGDHTEVFCYFTDMTVSRFKIIGNWNLSGKGKIEDTVDTDSGADAVAV